MKDKNLIWIIGAVAVIALFMFGGSTKKEAGDFVQFRMPEFGLSNIAYSPICGNELVGYGYVGPSSYDCVSSDIIATLGSYELCTRPGYDYDRLYMMEGTNGRYYTIDEYTEDSLSLSSLPVTPNFEVTCTGTEPCTVISWTPATSTVCSGESFSQTSNCGNVRSSTGTKDCSTPQTCSDLKNEALNAIVAWAVCVN